MATVWTESLDRRAIMMRSFKEDTSIDPSEDSTQMQLLLSKLRAAFDPAVADHNKTSLAMAATRLEPVSETNEDLVLTVTCRLPQGLKPLKWPMYLRKQPRGATATSLVLPIIEANHVKAQEVASLVSQLHDKDVVIAKLVDKLDAMGTGLEHVFNALGAKRKVTRAMAETRVKGLAPFNEGVFHSEFVSGGDKGRTAAASSADDVARLLDNVFGGESGGMKYQPDANDLMELTDWWTDLGAGAGIQLVERPKETIANEQNPSTPPPRTEGENDDFQVQSTPPHLMSPLKEGVTPNRKKAPVVIDEDTSDGEDEQIPDSNPPPHAVKQGTPKTKGRLGTLGRKKELSPSTKTPSPIDPDITLDDDGEETASDAEPASIAVKPAKTLSTARPERLGIQNKTTIEEEKRSSPILSDGGHVVTPKKTGHKKLGAIGKRNVAASEAEGKPMVGKVGQEANELAQRAREDEEDEEDEEGRADRRRALLQKELDRKAAAGPAKKKRKF